MNVVGVRHIGDDALEDFTATASSRP